MGGRKCDVTRGFALWCVDQAKVEAVGDDSNGDLFLAEEAFEDLDAPVKRIAAPDCPVPFAPVLEKAFIPQVDDVVAGLRELAEY